MLTFKLLLATSDINAIYECFNWKESLLSGFFFYFLLGSCEFL